MATAASPETLVTIYRTTCCHIQERRSFLLWELQIWYIFIISYASSLCTFQQFSLILSSQTVLLALTPPKQNLMLVSSIPVYISISSHYITTQGILFLLAECHMTNSISMVNLTRVMGEYFWKGIVWKTLPLCRCIRFVTEMIWTKPVRCVEDIYTFLHQLWTTSTFSPYSTPWNTCNKTVTQITNVNLRPHLMTILQDY